MGGYYKDGFLALVALVFAIFNWSNVVVIIATALIVLHSLLHVFGWCRCAWHKEAPKEPVKSESKKSARKK
jgi:hypothetical protein